MNFFVEGKLYAWCLINIYLGDYEYILCLYTWKYYIPQKHGLRVNIQRDELGHDLSEFIILAAGISEDCLVTLVIAPRRPPFPDILIVLKELKEFLEKRRAGLIRTAPEFSQHGRCIMIAQRLGDGINDRPEKAPRETVLVAAVQNVEVLVKVEQDLAVRCLVNRTFHDMTVAASGPATRMRCEGACFLIERTAFLVVSAHLESSCCSCLLEFHPSYNAKPLGRKHTLSHQLKYHPRIILIMSRQLPPEVCKLIIRYIPRRTRQIEKRLSDHGAIVPGIVVKIQNHRAPIARDDVHQRVQSGQRCLIERYVKLGLKMAHATGRRIRLKPKLRQNQ